MGESLGSQFTGVNEKQEIEKGNVQGPCLPLSQPQENIMPIYQESILPSMELRKAQIAHLKVELATKQSETYSTSPDYISSQTQSSFYESPFSVTESLSFTQRPKVLFSRIRAISSLPEKSTKAIESLGVYEKLLFLENEESEGGNEVRQKQSIYSERLIDFYSDSELISRVAELNRETSGNLENAILNLLTLGYSAQEIRIRFFDNDNRNNEYLLNILSQADNKLLKNTLQANISDIPITYYSDLLKKVQYRSESDGYLIVLQNLLKNETNSEYVEYIKTFFDAKFLQNNCNFSLGFPYEEDPATISTTNISEFVQDYSSAETIVASIALDQGSSVITSESTQLVEQSTDTNLVVLNWYHLPSETKRMLGNVVGLGVSISDLSCSRFPTDREVATLTENLKQMEILLSEETNIQYLSRLSSEFGINTLEGANIQLLSYITSDEGKTLFENLKQIKKDLAFQSSQDFFSIKGHKIEINCEQIKAKLQVLQSDSPIQNSLYYKLVKDAADIPSSELVLFLLQNNPETLISEGRQQVFKSFMNYEDRLYHNEVPLSFEKFDYFKLIDSRHDFALDTLARNGIPSVAFTAIYDIDLKDDYAKTSLVRHLRRNAEKWIAWSNGERLNYSFLRDFAGNKSTVYNSADITKRLFYQLDENFLDLSTTEREFFLTTLKLPTSTRVEILNTAPDINMLGDENIKRFVDFHVNVGSISNVQPVWGEDSEVNQILARIRQGAIISEQEQNTLNTMYQIIDEWRKVENSAFKGVATILLPQIMLSSKPHEAYKYIELIYTAENIPQILKAALASKQIYSIKDSNGEYQISKMLKLKDSEGLRLSPYLSQLPPEDAVNFFSRSIVRNAIESGSPEVLSFLESLSENKELLQRLDEDQAQTLEQRIKGLNAREFSLLSQFSTSVEWLLEIPAGTDLLSRLNNILSHTGVSKFTEISQIATLDLAQSAGFKNTDEMYKFIQQKLEVSNSRNRLIGQRIEIGENVLLQGDYLKSIKSDDLNAILRNGIHCGESISVTVGGGSISGNTPFDADFGVIDIISGDDGEIIQNSIVLATSMTSINDVVLVVQDDELVDTTNSQNAELRLGQRETFHSIYGDKQYNTGRKTHFGITEGTPSTNIKLIYLPNRFFEKEGAEKQLTKIALSLSFAPIFIPIKSRKGLEFSESDYNETQSYIAKLNQYLQGENDQDILELTLSSSKVIRDVFRLDAQTSEKYTLAEHTGFVLDRANRFYKKSFNEVHLSYREFELLLTLHDIGKPFPEDKKDQHRFTREFCTQIVEKLDLPQSKKRLIVEMASQNIIGNMLEGGTTPDEAVQQLEQIAKKCNIAVEDLYYYCKTYFMCDAGSYTKDADPNLEKGYFDDSFEFNHLQDSSGTTHEGEMRIKNVSWLTKIDELESKITTNK